MTWEVVSRDDGRMVMSKTELLALPLGTWRPVCWGPRPERNRARVSVRAGGAAGCGPRPQLRFSVRVTPATRAVVRIHPAAMRAYASQETGPDGQNQAVRWPKPPMGTRRSRV